MSGARGVQDSMVKLIIQSDHRQDVALQAEVSC